MRLTPTQLALIGLVLTNLFWASNAIIARYMSDSIPPLTLAFGRWLLAFILLLPFTWRSVYTCRQVIVRHAGLILLLGFLCVSTYNTVLYLAAHETTAINITLFSSSMPLIMLTISIFLLRHIPTRWQLTGIVCSFTGVVIIITRGDLNQLLLLNINSGDLMIIGIACVWSLYSVLLRKYPIGLKPLPLLAVFIAAGLPWLIILVVIEWLMVPNIRLAVTDIPLFFYVAIFPSILAYLFWVYGIKNVGPNIAALSTYLMPLFTASMAIPLLGESLSWYHILGGVLILTGLYFGSVFKSRS